MKPFRITLTKSQIADKPVRVLKIAGPGVRVVKTVNGSVRRTMAEALRQIEREPE